MDTKCTACAVCLLIASACAGSDGRSAALPAEGPQDTIPIRGPTVVGYLAVTQAEVDADDEAMEALSDFQFYWPGVERAPAACGVETIETYENRLAFLRGDSVELFAPRELETRVGYRLMRPDRLDLVLEGVHTDIGLLAAAVEYFEVPEDCWEPTPTGGGG